MMTEFANANATWMINAAGLIAIGSYAWVSNQTKRLKRQREERDSDCFVYRIRDTLKSGKKMALFLIDPQYDFCNVAGSLFVPGAVEDCKRISNWLHNYITMIDAIFVTLDTHQRYHIAHALFWVNGENEHPKPFTTISSRDVRENKWRASNQEHQKWAQEYVDSLEKDGRFDLVIWPDHCLVGTVGHSVDETVMDGILKWEALTGNCANYVLKGNNALTEHYSAFQGEVLVKNDPNTSFNLGLLNALKEYDRIIIAGQALSHCVNFTVRDLVQNLSPAERSKIYVLIDGCSNVTGCDSAGKTFIDDMKRCGVNFISCDEALE